MAHSQMKYYLETNSLRKLNNQLGAIKEICFTSALSIFELISGIREQDFHIRKVVIESIFNTGLEVIWLFPEEVTVNAFPGMEFQEDRIKPLKRLCQCLIESENISGFLEKASQGKYNLEFYQNLDKQYCSKFSSASLQGNKNLKAIIESQNEDSLREFSKSFNGSLPYNHQVNNSITLKAIASNLKDSLELSSGELIDEKKVYDHYDGSINIFISAFSLFTAKKSAEFNTPSKNDFIDLYHLIYLGNNHNYFIVTDDKMIYNNTSQVKKISEFIELLEITK